MSIQQLEAISLLRSAQCAANEAAESLSLAHKCIEEAGSAYAADAGRVRYLANELAEFLSDDLRSRQDHVSNVRFL